MPPRYRVHRTTVKEQDRDVANACALAKELLQNPEVAEAYREIQWEEHRRLTAEVEQLREVARLAEMQSDQSANAVDEYKTEVERLGTRVTELEGLLAAAHLCDCNPAARAALAAVQVES